MSSRRKPARKTAQSEEEVQQVAALGESRSGQKSQADKSPEGTDLRPFSGDEGEGDHSKGDSGPRHPSSAVPRISFDYFFLGRSQTHQVH